MHINKKKALAATTASKTRGVVATTSVKVSKPCNGCGSTTATVKARNAPSTEIPTAGGLVTPLTNIKLDLPSHFNPGLVRHNGKWLLAARFGSPKSKIRLVELDDDLRIVSRREVTGLIHPRCTGGCEDPRLIVRDGQLVMSFIGVEYRDGTVLVHQMMVDLDAVGAAVNVWAPIYGGRVRDREKNWAPFSHDGEQCFVYSIEPHVVLRTRGTSVNEWGRTGAGLSWDWGFLRGGAPPVRVGDEYYHWFHGTRPAANGDDTGAYYTLGLYCFEARPPFRVTRWCPEPIMHPDVVPGNKPVVFPCGAAIHNNEWVVSYGWNDRETRIVKYAAADVERALVSIGPMDARPVPPVYVIHCEEMPERRAACAAHLAERGITPSWWRSVHGVTWGLRTQKVHARDRFLMGPGHVGLNLGHWHLWQHLWGSGVEEALVVEDDVVLPPDFETRLAELRRALPSTWQFAFVGCLPLPENKIRERLPGGIVRCIEPHGTHCYLVRRSALPVLLDRMTEARAPFDSQIYENVLAPGLIDWYAASPPVAEQRTFTREWVSSTFDAPPPPCVVAVNVYGEPIEQIEGCLASVARHLPGAAVRVFADDVRRPDVAALCSRFGFGFVTGERLGTNAASPQWWLRMLKSMRGTGAPVCFKIDPDTRFVGTPELLPDADYFGTVEGAYVQGGCTGLSRACVEKIIDHATLLRPEFSDVTTYYRGDGPVENWPLCDDQMLGAALKSVGVTPTAWGACLSRWRTPIASHECAGRVAVHPIYEHVPAVSFCTPIKGRTWQLKQCYRDNIERAARLDLDCEFVLVDMDSPDDLDDHVRNELAPWLWSRRLRYMRYVDPYPIYRMGHAENVAALASRAPVIVSLAADNICSDEFFLEVRRFTPDVADGTSFVRMPFGPPWDTERAMFSRTAFMKIGGYEESLDYWGDQDLDLFDRLERAGLSTIYFTKPEHGAIPNDDAARNAYAPDPGIDRWVGHEANRAKLRELRSVDPGVANFGSSWGRGRLKGPI